MIRTYLFGSHPIVQSAETEDMTEIFSVWTDFGSWGRDGSFSNRWKYGEHDSMEFGETHPLPGWVVVA